MLRLRQLAQQWYFNLPLCAILLFFTTSCETNESIEPVAEHSGEELYKSIFFATGDFAKNLSTQREQLQVYKSLSEEQKVEMNNKLDELSKEILKENPTFFADFKTAITSKDHLKIKRAMEEAAEVTYKTFVKITPEIKILSEQVSQDVQAGVILTEGEIDLDKLEQRKPEYERLLKNNMITSNGKPQACSIAAACTIYLAIAIHAAAAISAAIVIVLAAAVAVQVELWFSDTETAYNVLTFEIMIDEIATNI